MAVDAQSENSKPENGNPARTKSAIKRMQIIARRALVAKLYLRGLPEEAIAATLDVCVRTVRKDKQAIKEEWRASSIRDWDQQAELEKRKLDDIEAEAREAFERSKGPSKVRTVEKDENGNVLSASTKIEEQRDGNPNFLAQALKAAADRRKLLGLEHPTTKNHAHFHAHIGNGIDGRSLPGTDEQRDLILSLAERFAIAGEVFEGVAAEVPPERVPTVGGSNGHSHPAGSNGHADGTDAAAE